MESALLGGTVLNAEYRKKWLDSIQPEDPAKPDGAKNGYGIAQFSWAGNTVTHSRGETPGYNSHMGVETANQMTLVIWCNQPVTTNLLATANSMMIEVLDQIYVQSPKVAPPTATPTS